jgi:predicted nucleic acid-binding protein
MKTALVDANVILRFITKDPPHMADAARNLFRQAESGEIDLIIQTITVAEVVWVLESFYNYTKIQVAETFGAFLRCAGLRVEQANLIQEALSLYHGNNLDFADALLASTALRKGPLSIYSFDRHVDRVAGIERLEPLKDSTTPKTGKKL